MSESRYHLNCERCVDPYWSSEAFPNPQLCAQCRDEDEKDARIAELETENAALRDAVRRAADLLGFKDCPDFSPEDVCRLTSCASTICRLFQQVLKGVD